MNKTWRAFLAVAIVGVLCSCDTIKPYIPDLPPVPSIPSGTTTNAPDVPADLPTNGTLIDPPNYPAEWVRSRAEAEEVGMEQDCGIVVRCRVWYPSARNWFILSTPFKGHVRNVSGGKQADTPFEAGGAVWVLRGWRAHSPDNNSDPTPTIDEAGNTSSLSIAMWEVRAQ